MSGFDSKRQASRDLLEPQSAKAIAAEQSWDTGLWFVAITASEAHLQAALRRLTIAVEGTQAANPWRDAIDAQLFCLHLGTADSFNDANEALEALIDWHVAVALDPAVSSDAQALIDRGRAAVAESLSDAEIGLLFDDCIENHDSKPLAFARSIEQAHGIGIKGSKT